MASYQTPPKTSKRLRSDSPPDGEASTTSWPRVNTDDRDQRPIATATWPRFLLLKSNDEETSLSKLNSCAIALNIENVIGKKHKITRLRSGDLLIEVESQRQSVAILKMTQLQYSGRTYSVKAEPHRSLNSTKGVARSHEFKLFDSEEEIVTCLTHQGVVACKRLTFKRDGNEAVPSGTVFLTFNSSTRPEKVKLGFLSVKVDEFVPAPLRCFNCQRFGHVKPTCKGQRACARCAGSHEEDRNCKKAASCANCGGSHPVFSRDCPVAIREKEIQAVKTQRKITYRDAKAVVEARYPQGVSYSSVASAGSAPRVGANPVSAVQNATARTFRSIGVQCTNVGIQCNMMADPPTPFKNYKNIIIGKEAVQQSKMISSAEMFSATPVVAAEAKSGTPAATAPSVNEDLSLTDNSSFGGPAEKPVFGASAGTSVSGKESQVLSLQSLAGAGGPPQHQIPSTDGDKDPPKSPSVSSMASDGEGVHTPTPSPMLTDGEDLPKPSVEKPKKRKPPLLPKPKINRQGLGTSKAELDPLKQYAFETSDQTEDMDLDDLTKIKRKKDKKQRNKNKSTLSPTKEGVGDRSPIRPPHSR